jgi:hypothetical protein
MRQYTYCASMRSLYIDLLLYIFKHAIHVFGTASSIESQRSALHGNSARRAACAGKRHKELGLRQPAGDESQLSKMPHSELI